MKTKPVNDLNKDTTIETVTAESLEGALPLAMTTSESIPIVAMHRVGSKTQV